MYLNWNDLAPWRLAYRLFENPDSKYEPTYWLSWFRSISATVAIVIISLPYRTTGTVLEEAWEKTVQAALAGAAALAVLVPLFYYLNDASGRQYMRQQSRGPLISLGSGAVALTVGRAVVTDPDRVSTSGFLANLALIIFGIWFGIFVAFAAVFAARSVFRASEAHAFLAPTCGIIISLSMLITEIIQFDTKGMPSNLWLLLGLSGFASTSAISLLEIRLLLIDGYRIQEGSASTLTQESHIGHHSYNARIDESLEDWRRLRRAAATPVLLMVIGAGCIAFFLVYQQLGGGMITFLALGYLTFILVRAMWNRGGYRIRNWFD